jgi:hypothetical protein
MKIKLFGNSEQIVFYKNLIFLLKIIFYIHFESFWYINFKNKKIILF